MRASSHLALLASALSLAACESGTARAARSRATTVVSPIADEAQGAVVPDDGPRAPRADAPTCEDRIAASALEPPSPRTTAYVRRLPEVLIRAPIDPVLFVRWPDEHPRGARATALRGAIDRASVPGRAVRLFLGTHSNRALRRGVLLTDGYVFSTRPAVALALAAWAELDDLFDAQRVYRARDGVVDVLVRGSGGYVEPDGTRAMLRLNDRLSETSEALEDPLGIDLEVVREETGALRTIPIAMGERAASLELVFPDGSRRRSLVAIEDGHTEVVCIGGAPETLAATRDDAARFWTRHRAVVAAARALVEESPRFDEPSDEPEGVQQDGELRVAWTQAYERGESTFTFGTVEYPVFDAQGRPIPPEVCIDFVFDAWQRAGGSWYRRAGEVPGLTHGAIDLTPADLPRRSVPQLLASADAVGSVLDRYDVPEEDIVPLARGAEFASAIAREAHAFREGDALIVYGLRLQDFHRHYHALLVIRTDPMTGVPMLVADNQGRPHFRTLANAMQAAPLRSIVCRLRLDLDVLAAPGR